MPLVTVVMYLVIVGVVLWLINNYVPMDGKIRQIVNAVVVVAVVVWLLQVFGVMGPLTRIRVG
jgi:low temperature requirement protein LtrA